MSRLKCVLTCVVCLTSTTFAFGDTVTTGIAGSGVYPIMAEVFTTLDLAETPFGDDPNPTITQTFQVPNTFDLAAFGVSYEYDTNAAAPAPADVTVDWEIFEVLDVNAAALTAGATLFTSTGNVYADQGDNGEGLLTLTTPFTLAATTGTAGYGLRLSNASNADGRGFEWERSTGNSTNGGDIYAFGSSYEAGVSEGARDYSLALVSVVPEPSSLVVVGLAGLAAIGRRRR
ncbi:PEP-CTERM sorting domain-containing protein [bacterium]|nr:PEP-CTERM sorting domain-containing protein [bacterium]